MLRITAVSAGAVDYLLRGSNCAEHRHAPERNQDRELDGPGYFLSASEHGEAPGIWGGSGAGYFGVRAGSAVTEEDVRKVFGELKDPESDEYLGRPPRNYKSYEKLYVEAIAREPDATPERLREIKQECLGGQRKSVAYYDLTFSPVKSVSVYYAALLAEGRTEDASKVLAAHENAINKAMAYTEKHAAYTRTGYHGKALDGRSVGKYEEATGLIWTAWRHSTNRDEEPQLHSHVAVLNRVVTASDGKWRALDGKSFQPIKQGIDAYYTRALEHDLHRDLGVVFANRPDGKAREILGIDPELCADASSRRATIEARVAERVAEFVEQYGHEPSPQQLKEITQTETLDSRAAKTGAAPDEQYTKWSSNKSDRLSASLDAVEAAAAEVSLNGHPDLKLGAHATIEEALQAAVESVQTEYSTWDRGNLEAAIGAELDRSHGIDGDLHELADQVLKAGNQYGVLTVTAPDPTTVPAALQRADGRSIYRPHVDEKYTTERHLSTEQRVVVGARQLTAPTIDGPELELLRVELEANGLKPDQAAAVLGTVSSGHAGDVLVGPAGAGKSHTVGVLTDVWHDHFGTRVLGLATSQRATQELEGHGLEAINTTVFLNKFTPDPQTGEVRDFVRPGDLFIVDESGMSSTSELARIAKLVEDGGGKLLYTGDPEQLDAVGAGGLFDLIGRDNGAFELENVQRFHDINPQTGKRVIREWEADASLRMRAGDTSVVREYEDRGRLRGGTRDEIQDAAIRGYMADTLDGLESLLIVGSNDEAADLSARIHAQLVELGRVQPEVLTSDRDRNPVAVGDVIQARKNARLDTSDGRRVINRETYEVLGHDDRGRLMVRQRESGAIAHLPESYVHQHVALAYASTDYAAQGRNVDTGHGLLDETTTRNAAYPRLTRGTLRNTGYIETHREPDEHGVERLEVTPGEAFAAVLERDGAQAAALLAMREGLETSAGLGTVGTQWDLVSKEYARDRYTDVLSELLTPEQMDNLVGEHGYDRFMRAIREAELKGHNAENIIRESVEQRDMSGADSWSDVLRARLRKHAEERQPEQQVDPTNWTTLQAPIEGKIGQFTHELAVLASDRQQTLGRQVAEELPEWVLATLGPMPEDEGQREEWIRRAGIAAGYRELHAIPDASLSLGPAPSREEEFHRALWQQAYAALGRPTDAMDYSAASEHELREMRGRWQRERTWAPAYVADELQEAYQVAADYRADAAYGRAQLEQMAVESEVYAESVQQVELAERLAEQYAEKARLLEDVHLARGHWFDATEDARLTAQMATEELERRDMPLEPQRPQAEQLELFEIADEAEVGTDPGPAEPVIPAQQQAELAAERAEREQHADVAAEVEAKRTPEAEQVGEQAVEASVEEETDRRRWWQRWADKIGVQRERQVEPEQAEVDPDRGEEHEREAAAPRRAEPLRERQDEAQPARDAERDRAEKLAADREPGLDTERAEERAAEQQVDPNQLELFDLQPTPADVVQAQPVRSVEHDRVEEPDRGVEAEAGRDAGETLAEVRRQARAAEQMRTQRAAAERARAEQRQAEQAAERAAAERQRRDEAERVQQQQTERTREQQHEREPEIELVRSEPSPQAEQSQRGRGGR